MIDLLTLTAAMITLTGQPGAVRCVPPTYFRPNVIASVQIGKFDRINMKRSTCRDLRKARPNCASLDTFTHEIVHILNPELEHGRRYQVEIWHLLPHVVLLLNVRNTCTFNRILSFSKESSNTRMK